MTIRVMLVCAALLAMALPARANPCKDDAAKLCKDVKPGGGRIIRCLKEHEAELSDGCKATQARVKERAGDVMTHCKADVDKLCADTRPGRGRKLRCLREHHDELSDACKDALGHARGAKIDRRR